MKSIISRSFLLPVLAVAIIFGFSSRVYGQSVCGTFGSTNTAVYYRALSPEFDTVITIMNTSNDTVEISEIAILGDAEILHLPPSNFGGGVILLPGQLWDFEVGIYLPCPPTQAVYTGRIGLFSDPQTLCSIDTFTVYIQFPITDSITLDVPSNVDTISIAPSMALSAHKLHIVNSYPDDIFLDSLSITSNIAYFDQLGEQTFVFNDSLLAGQANDSAIMTVVPTDTGIQDIGLILYYSYTTQSYTIQDSVTHNSLNEYPLSARVPLFNNLIPQQKKDSTFYIANAFPDTISITELILIGDSEPGMPWSIDTNIGTFPLKLPIKLQPSQRVPIGIGALDSGCDPITGSLEVIYSYPCGTDTATFPLYGREKQGACNPLACVSTVQSLDFGAVLAGDSVTQALTLTNQTYDTVELNMSLGGSDATQFTNSTLLINPITILPLSSVDISCTFTMPSSASQQNYSAILIAIEKASNEYFLCDTLFVPLTASLLIPAGVSNAATPEATVFTLVPNPASGEVTVMLPQNGSSTVEIYDVLGNLIVHKQTVGNYVWSGDAPGGAAASGVYIVRVTEREVDGSFVVTSKRLIFER